MIDLRTISDAIALGLAAFFAVDGFILAAEPRLLQAIKRQARCSTSFLYSAATFCFMTAVFLVVPQMRLWGGMLGAIVLFVITASLLFHERYLAAVPTILLLAAIPVAVV